jgi:hypothetical protein
MDFSAFSLIALQCKAYGLSAFLPECKSRRRPDEVRCSMPALHGTRPGAGARVAIGAMIAQARRFGGVVRAQCGQSEAMLRWFPVAAWNCSSVTFHQNSPDNSR